LRGSALDRSTQDDGLILIGVETPTQIGAREESIDRTAAALKARDRQISKLQGLLSRGADVAQHQAEAAKVNSETIQTLAALLAKMESAAAVSAMAPGIEAQTGADQGEEVEQAAGQKRLDTVFTAIISVVFVGVIGGSFTFLQSVFNEDLALGDGSAVRDLFIVIAAALGGAALAALIAWWIYRTRTAALRRVNRAQRRQARSAS
jgi:hypothetical protein